jgi:endonuclease YncB( thermonuclease family)
MTGIDAPEKSQPFGEFCRKLLAQRVAGSEVRVELRGRDRYGRHLGVVFASPRAEGEVMSAANSSVRTDAESLALDINLAQVQAGCAWHYRQYEKQQKPGERVSYSQAEKKAREARVGLWIDSEPLEPWSFRRERQTSRQSRKKARRSS